VPRWSWTKINDADKQAVIRLMCCGLSVRQAADRVGRTQTVVYNWIQGDPEFAEAINAVLAERDDEATAFRARVRVTAETMLDHLLDLADPDKNVNVPERNQAVRTFFKEVHNPLLAPRASQGSVAPMVFVNAQQAALLFAGGVGGNGGATQSGPTGDGRAPDAPRGAGRSTDAAQPSGQVSIADSVQAAPAAAGGGSSGADEGDIGEAAGEGVEGG